MDKFTKLSIYTDIGLAMMFLKQMRTAVGQGDIKAAEKFIPQVNYCLERVEDELVASNNELVFDEL
jgi:hypothetical protein